jgi:hypothetical protein
MGRVMTRLRKKIRRDTAIIETTAMPNRTLNWPNSAARGKRLRST